MVGYSEIKRNIFSLLVIVSLNQINTQSKGNKSYTDSTKKVEVLIFRLRN